MSALLSTHGIPLTMDAVDLCGQTPAAAVATGKWVVTGGKPLCLFDDLAV